MSKSREMLAEAFAGEAQANRRYLAFARKAEEDGFPHIAKILRAAAHAETIHAHNHLRAMKAVGSTVENMEAAINGETYEFESMYPEMMSAAKEEGDQEAYKSFFYANEVEKMHAEIFKMALASAGAGKDAASREIHVCPVCGCTVEGEAPETCPVCGRPGSAFTRID
ncbi:MAG TPA: rubrerythrin family protein [Thermodesulfobacteriaceae bacterium]|nr:rubrerythrin family protein [Thermodesulfobacteriaceae bacterium]